MISLIYWCGEEKSQSKWKFHGVTFQLFPGRVVKAKLLSCRAILSLTCAFGLLSAIRQCMCQTENLVRNSNEEIRLVNIQWKSQIYQTQVAKKRWWRLITLLAMWETQTWTNGLLGNE